MDSMTGAYSDLFIDQVATTEDSFLVRLQIQSRVPQGPLMFNQNERFLESVMKCVSEEMLPS